MNELKWEVDILFPKDTIKETSLLKIQIYLPQSHPFNLYQQQ